MKNADVGPGILQTLIDKFHKCFEFAGCHVRQIYLSVETLYSLSDLARLLNYFKSWFNFTKIVLLCYDRHLYHTKHFRSAWKR